MVKHINISFSANKLTNFAPGQQRVPGGAGRGGGPRLPHLDPSGPGCQATPALYPAREWWAVRTGAWSWEGTPGAVRRAPGNDR